MVADAIRDCSHRKGIVLDAFTGSGTTLIAAEQTGRRGFGIEIDPLYCDVTFVDCMLCAASALFWRQTGCHLTTLQPNAALE